MGTYPTCCPGPTAYTRQIMWLLSLQNRGSQFLIMNHIDLYFYLYLIGSVSLKNSNTAHDNPTNFNEVRSVSTPHKPHTPHPHPQDIAILHLLRTLVPLWNLGVQIRNTNVLWVGMGCGGEVPRESPNRDTLCHLRPHCALFICDSQHNPWGRLWSKRGNLEDRGGITLWNLIDDFSRLPQLAQYIVTVNVDSHSQDK